MVVLYPHLYNAIYLLNCPYFDLKSQLKHGVNHMTSNTDTINDEKRVDQEFGSTRFRDKRLSNRVIQIIEDF